MDKKEIKLEFKRSRLTSKNELRRVVRNAKAEYKIIKRSAKEKHSAQMLRINSERLTRLDEYYDETGKRKPKDPPKRGLLEEIGNATTHGVGAIFAIVALVLMCVAANTATEYVGAAIYSFGLGVMFTMSCMYHSFRHGSAVKRLFRRFDYSCIYLLIGATFAPILLCYIGGTLGIVFFIVQWAAIVTGISLVGVFGPARLRFIHIPLYLVLGWCGLMFLPEMIIRGDYAFLGLILGGGVIYSLGLIPFILKKKVAHFIWHFFVLAGAVVQWVGVYTTVYLS